MAPLQTSNRALARLAARRGFAPVLAALLLGVALWVMTRAWDASLLDRFQFRLTQTALTAARMQGEAFHLAYPLPIFGPPWSVPHEFPLYQWLVARLTQATSLSLVSAARLLGIVFFLLALPAVYGLAALVESDSRRRLLVPAVVLSAPVCLFYSRAFMIESCACAFAVWFLYAHVRSLRGPDWRWTAAAAVLGVVAALVKITTFALFGIAAAAFSLHELWRARRRPAQPTVASLPRLALASAIPAVLALAAGTWWVAYSDAVKRTNLYAEMLTSANLHGWLYGTFAQRADPAFWSIVGHQLTVGVASGGMWLLVAAGFLLVAPGYRWAALLCAAGFLLGPLLFSNLYAMHEYYYFPSAFFAAAAAGCVLAGVAATPRLGATLKAVALLAFFGLQAANFNRDYARTLRYRPAPAPPLMAVIRLATAADGIVLVHGWDWNTLIPYYAERRAILVPRSQEENPDRLLAVLAQLRPERVAAMVIQGAHKADPTFIQWRIGQLNLSPTPVARSPDGDLYLPAAGRAALQAKVTDPFAFPGVEFDFASPAERPDPRLRALKFNPADYAEVASPAPVAVFNPWGVDVALLQGRPTIFANAPAELHFHVPAGATHLEATVGLNERAYTGPTPTDGVDVVIFELLESGGRRVLYQRNLNPVLHPADRGPQSIALTDFGPVTGPLVLAIYPGPADNIACDWSYWRSIRIY